MTGHALTRARPYCRCRYQEHQANITPEREEEYVSYCGDLIFRISILEKRLHEHRAAARTAEYALENRLHQDPRLEGLA